MSETARRIKLLILIKQHQEGPLDEKKYSASAMVDNRIERLVQMGQIRNEGNHYITKNPWLLWIYYIIASWKNIINTQ